MQLISYQSLTPRLPTVECSSLSGEESLAESDFAEVTSRRHSDNASACLNARCAEAEVDAVRM